EAARIARQVRYIETAVDPDFQAQFVNAMHLPHSSDPFPHLKKTLDAIPHQEPPRRKRRFPRKGRSANN
ncbi:MAG: ASKHA domain-containing protein, partial [Anaerolineales bacterium]